MKKYVASVKDSEGRMAILREEYNTKKDFKSDIKANGYKINYSYIFTEEEYEKFINEDSEFMAWFMERLEKRQRNSRISNRIAKLRRNEAKKDAERLERLKAEIEAEKETEAEAEDVIVETEAEMTVEKFEVDFQRVMKEETKKIHHKTVEKYRRIQKELEEKLGRNEEYVKRWLPEGYELDYGIEYGIYSKELDCYVTSITTTDEYKRVCFERAEAWCGILNSTYREYQIHQRMMDLNGLLI